MAPAEFHIVVRAAGLFLTRSPDPDWRTLQARFDDFITSMGPLDLEGALELAFEEWPSLTWREAQIRAWAAAGGTVFDLEGPADQPQR